MTRPWPLFARLLALLLLLQWGMAFAHCLRPLADAGSGKIIEICGTHGLTTALLDDDGRPLEKAKASHAVCPGCCGPVAVGAPAPEAVHVPVAWPDQVTIPSRAGLPVAPARAPPQQPRAPPTS